MKQINIHYAKTHLSTVLSWVSQGEEVIIAKAGKPVAKLTPFKGIERQLGLDQGKVNISDDFDESSAEIEKLFGME